MQVSRGSRSLHRAGASLVHDLLAKNADARNVDLDGVAVPHPERRLPIGANSPGRSGDDDVAGLEFGEGGTVLDERRYIEHEVGRGRPLNFLSVEAGDERELARIRDFVPRDHPGAEAARIRGGGCPDSTR